MKPDPGEQADEGPRRSGQPGPALTGEGITDLAGLMRSSQEQLERARRNMEAQFELLQEQGRALEERDLRIAELEDALAAGVPESRESGGAANRPRRDGKTAVRDATRRLKDKEIELVRLREELAIATSEDAAPERTGVYLAARLWRHSGGRHEDLWTGTRLHEALALRDRADVALSERELEFLRASEILEDYTRVRLQEAAAAPESRPPGRTLNLVLAGLVALVILEQIGIIIYLTR